MKSVYLSILCLVLIFPSSAQESVFSLQNETHQRIRVGQPFNQSAQIEPFPDETPISGLVISGQLTLNSDSSLIRIILLDDRYNEYLVFESYSPLAELGTFSIDEIGEETILLNQLVPSSIRMEIHDATLLLKEIVTSEAGAKKSGFSKEDLQQKQLQSKINKINDNLINRSIPWIAGETSISRMTFEEKKAYFGGVIPNLGGLEYYTGGLFVLSGILDAEDPMGSNYTSVDIGASSFVIEFSWKNVHGQDWVTPVKNQGGCNSCWAFGATAAAELLVNLYFNRHIDYDLSEQNLISCNSGNCSLGAPVSLALDYIKNTGIITEECFPYIASDQDCSEICAKPQDRIQIDSYSYFHKEDEKKRAVLSGATSANVAPWAHAVQVVGYKLLEEGDTLYLKNDSDTCRWITIGEEHPLLNQTAWLCKNSWGENWGEEGYVYLLGDEQDIMMYSLHGPASSLIYNDIDVICNDSDSDGYFTWGNGPKPPHCPDSPPEPDGDDSNRCVGPRDEFGNFTSTTSIPEAKDTVIVGDQMVPDLFASGENVRWYSDKKLLNPVHMGNVYATGLEEFGDYTLYATQTGSGCESTASEVSLSIWREIPRPFGHDTIIKKGEPALLSAKGKPGAILKWYGDPMLTDSLFTGEAYDSQRLDTGIYTYFVTQTICQNESAPDTVVLRIKDLVYIPDQTFLQALTKEGVDTNNDGIRSYSEAGEVTSLDVGPGINQLCCIKSVVL